MTNCTVIVGLGISLMIGGVADAAARSQCKAAVAERLDELNVDAADIRKISTVVQHSSHREGGPPTGYEAWVSLSSCKGNLVIKLSKRCRVRQVYGRGECKLGG